jgi:hypothetical protein
MGVRAKVHHDGPRVWIAIFNFGCGQLWLRVPVGPMPRA